MIPVICTYRQVFVKKLGFRRRTAECGEARCVGQACFGNTHGFVWGLDFVNNDQKRVQAGHLSQMFRSLFTVHRI